MSCHSIGRGMNSVVEKVLELYDNDEIGREQAIVIIAACRKGVNYCDGNEYEATECMDGCRCGKCLKVFEKGEKFFSVYDTSDVIERRQKYNIVDKSNPPLATDSMCEKCFDAVINEVCNDILAGERERNYIMQQWSEDHYVSKGV